MKEIPHGYAHLVGLPNVDKLKISREIQRREKELQFGVARANPRILSGFLKRWAPS